jgi:uracil-DNA glycosylase
MDARELLRRYLEQRREMGESELVLDSLSVDEVLRIVGAKGESTAGVSTSPKPAPESTAGENSAVDWRSALSNAGAAPASARDRKPEKGHRFDPPNDKVTPTVATPGIVVPEAPGTDAKDLGRLDSLTAIAEAVASCRRCPLYSTATNPVPGEGNPDADLMCVGEAPGENEDLQGRPFVGAAGQLLTKILAAIDLTRDEVFICNVLKHRPPGNRNPEPSEVTACSPYLVRQIELVRPRVILAFGKFAAQTLLNSTLALSALRGQIHRYHGVPLIVTYHPAALLRNPSWKRPTWEDVQLARRILDNSQSSGAKPG